MTAATTITLGLAPLYTLCVYQLYITTYIATDIVVWVRYIKVWHHKKTQLKANNLMCTLKIANCIAKTNLM